MVERPAPYDDLIRRRLEPGCTINPRHVEAWMRIEHPTLNGLSPEQFDREVEIARDCIKRVGVAESERVAQSMGI